MSGIILGVGHTGEPTYSLRGVRTGRQPAYAGEVKFRLRRAFSITVPIGMNELIQELQQNHTYMAEELDPHMMVVPFERVEAVIRQIYGKTE